MSPHRKTPRWRTESAANDHDPEGDPLTITGFSGGQNYRRRNRDLEASER
jgi:hypothetical protein